MKRILFFVLLFPFFVACNDDDQSKIPYRINIATVENPNNSTAFYFRLDNDTLMWTDKSNFPYYRPKDGQRIIANYTILEKKADSETYQYAVKLNDVYEVLTKGIFKISPEKQDSIGNDLIQVEDMWIGSDYLNVEFVYTGYDRIHFINLVSDSLKTYTDNKIHLEFRHNANGDYPMYRKWGVVSFDLRSLRHEAVADSLVLVIHTRETGTANPDKTYERTYKFQQEASQQISKQVAFPLKRNEIVR